MSNLAQRGRAGYTLYDIKDLVNEITTRGVGLQQPGNTKFRFHFAADFRLCGTGQMYDHPFFSNAFLKFFSELKPLE